MADSKSTRPLVVIPKPGEQTSQGNNNTIKNAQAARQIVNEVKNQKK